MKNFRIEAAIVALGLALMGLFIKNGIYSLSTRDRVVSVRGLAEKEVKADHVIWPVIYKTAGNDITAVNAELTNASRKIVAFLRRGGIKPADISTGVPQINDLWSNDYVSNARNRYTAQVTVTVSSREVDKVRSLMPRLGELMAEGIAIAPDYSATTQYDFTSLNKIKPGMIEQATKNAREAAEKFAKDSESKLGKIKSAEQGLFTIEDRDKIRNYFMETCPNFLIVAELVFNSLIRPAEIARIRVGQVHLKEKVIRLDEEQTKTGYARDCVLTDELIEIIAKMLAPGYPSDYFLIGPGFVPGDRSLTTKAFNKKWIKMREATGIAETIQLYSLRDSGLTGMFDKGADANTVKQAADHHDLKITSIYCNHVDKELVSKVRKYTPKF